MKALTSLDFFPWVVCESSPTKCHPCVMEGMKTKRRLLFIPRIWSFSLFNVIIMYHLPTALKCWVWIQSLAICSKQYFSYYMTFLQNWCSCIFFLSIDKKDTEAFSFKLLFFFPQVRVDTTIFIWHELHFLGYFFQTTKCCLWRMDHPIAYLPKKIYRRDRKNRTVRRQNNHNCNVAAFFSGFCSI